MSSPVVIEVPRIAAPGYSNLRPPLRKIRRERLWKTARITTPGPLWKPVPEGMTLPPDLEYYVDTYAEQVVQYVPTGGGKTAAYQGLWDLARGWDGWRNLGRPIAVGSWRGVGADSESLRKLRSFLDRRPAVNERLSPLRDVVERGLRPPGSPVPVPEMGDGEISGARVSRRFALAISAELLSSSLWCPPVLPQESAVFPPDWPPMDRLSIACGITRLRIALVPRAPGHAAAVGSAPGSASACRQSGFCLAA
ncbi:hypothetical protein [Kitasatospora sp. NPDC006786]|uniref:hypothetical protein n=1 Tax=unclassified Kitasatospora TaxID=2633591 RepID=UPI0033E03C1C